MNRALPLWLLALALLVLKANVAWGQLAPSLTCTNGVSQLYPCKTLAINGCTFTPSVSTSTATYTCGGSGSGTVTSVGLSMPSDFAVMNSPVTSSGTIVVSRTAQTANTVLAGPTTGSSTTPAFRALVSQDVPTSLAGDRVFSGTVQLTNTAIPPACDGNTRGLVYIAQGPPDLPQFCVQNADGSYVWALPGWQPRASRTSSFVAVAGVHYDVSTAITAVTVTLPSCTSSLGGNVIGVRKTSSDSNLLTIQSIAGNINGASSQVTSVQFTSVTLRCAFNSAGASEWALE